MYNHKHYKIDEAVSLDTTQNKNSILKQSQEKEREKKDKDLMQFYKRLVLNNDQNMINSMYKDYFLQQEYEQMQFKQQTLNSIQQETKYLYNVNCRKVNMHMVELGQPRKKMWEMEYQDNSIYQKYKASISNYNSQKSLMNSKQKSLFNSKQKSLLNNK